ncbi:9403_t:CDS:2 [Paraglomus brasilianum]|uniref:ER membrane protein complex subunit 3 n=1 Tax=Paraglomus brasilianum TaxID=144538 RepID=A0A9N9FKN5_9GLOM|nr:9403_t:CDS:2 [Paraglomus brasilianum]
MSQPALAESQALYLDPVFVMVLVGILRHQITLLLSGSPKKPTCKAIRETKALQRGVILRTYGNNVPPSAFSSRKTILTQAYERGVYLKNPGQANTPVNPMTDPQGMEMMMEGMKKNMAMIIPQTIIMGWINFFFSGFVLIKLPFPLTVRFKTMLQRGVETPDMDVTWVSSLSWYFLNLFGLRPVYTLLLGEDNSADGMRDMAAMSTMGMTQTGQPQDFNKLFQTEKENLQLTPHEWELDEIENRLLVKYGKRVESIKEVKKEESIKVKKEEGSEKEKESGLEGRGKRRKGQKRD